MKINKYGFNESEGITLNNNLILAGYVNKYEYEIIGSRNSYLYNANTYYTMTENNTNVYYISSENGVLNNISVTENENYGFRTTHYIKENARVRGTGSYSDPFVFRNADIKGPIISYNINSDTTYTKNKIIEVKFTDKSEIKNNQNVKYKWQTSNSCPSTLSEYTKSVILGNLNKENNTYYAVANINTPPETGEYYLCIAPGIYDINDNASSGSYAGPYYIDNESPKIEVEVTSTSSTATISIVSKNDNVGIKYYKYGLSTTKDCFPEGEYLEESKTYNLNEDEYYLCAQGVDKAGNESEILSEKISLFKELTYSQISKNYSCKNNSVGDNYIFVYTGECEIFDDSPSKDQTSTGKEGSWRIKFKTSGDLTFNSDVNIDTFLVGGGGTGGSSGSMVYSGGGGGGGGYTTTANNISLVANNKYSITVGGKGEKSIAFDYSATGGTNGGRETPGSGGNSGGAGGENDCDCKGSSGGSYGSGKTCEFSEGTSKGCARGDNFAYSAGGAGGGGATKNCTGTYTECGGGASGKGLSGTNSGRGGNGAQGGRDASSGGSGSSGVVVIRDAR